MLRDALVLVLAVAVSGCAVSAATSGRVVVKDERAAIDVRFSDRDVALIRDYYEPKKKRLPPGLAKRDGGLPPGLAKRDKLPPGLASEPLPRDLESTLSPLSGNFVRLRVGRDIVLMESRARVVLDVVYGIGI